MTDYLLLFHVAMVVLSGYVYSILYHLAMVYLVAMGMPGG